MAEKCKTKMAVFRQVKDISLDKIVDSQGAEAFMKTIVRSNVPGKQMQAGVFQLEPGLPFKVTYCYDMILLVLNGDFKATHEGHATHDLKVGDSVYIPTGSKIEYSTSTANSRLYFVIQPPQAEDCGRVHAGLSANPAPVVQTNVPGTNDIPPLENEEKANAFLKDILMSTVSGKEMTSGVYKIQKGPCHDYTYDYEEFKYIVEGQLNLTDGTGQYVEAKAGDLMYFPDGTFVNFGTVEHGLGFFVGQRLGGTA